MFNSYCSLYMCHYVADNILPREMIEVRIFYRHRKADFCGKFNKGHIKLHDAILENRVNVPTSSIHFYNAYFDLKK